MIAIVEEISKDYYNWEKLLEENSNASDAILKYSGFEGNLIESIDSSDREEYFSILIDEMKVLSAKNRKARLLNVSSLNSQSITILNGSIFLGFEFGIFDDNSNVYSSIFHEILFGLVPESIKFRERLNNNGLFPSTNVLNEYIELHKQLYLNGYDVEHHDLLSSFSICEFFP